MTNEFHTLNGDCSTFAPSGPGYEGISMVNQVCTVLGSQPGQATVSGNAYLGLAFGYYFRNLWRVRVQQPVFCSQLTNIQGLWNPCRFWHILHPVPPDLYRNQYQ